MKARRCAGPIDEREVEIREKFTKIKEKAIEYLFVEAFALLRHAPHSRPITAGLYAGRRLRGPAPAHS